MDLSFIRRQRPAVIDLAALLARTSAAQSASPTARAQVRLDTVAHINHDDPHVALFAAADEAASASASASLAAVRCGGSFALISDAVFSPRQPN